MMFLRTCVSLVKHTTATYINQTTQLVTSNRAPSVTIPIFILKKQDITAIEKAKLVCISLRSLSHMHLLALPSNSMSMLLWKFLRSSVVHSISKVINLADKGLRTIWLLIYSAVFGVPIPLLTCSNLPSIVFRSTCQPSWDPPVI